MTRNGSDPNYALIELYSDGHVKAYGQKSLNCFIFNRPHVTSAKSAILAEQLIDKILPLPFRAIYFAGMVRKTANLRKISPDAIQSRIDDIRLFNAIGSNDRPRFRSAKEVVRSYLAG